jgi:hypothetical protein
MCIETESDDETIDHCPHRQRIIAAAKLAKAEQERLEREYGLRDGRRPKRTPGGISIIQRHGPILRSHPRE